MNRGSVIYFYATQDAHLPGAGYLFRVQGVKPGDWRGDLFRFRSKRQRDGWVSAGAERRVRKKTDYVALFADYAIVRAKRGRWNPTGDAYGSEVFQLTKNLYWPV